MQESEDRSRETTSITIVCVDHHGHQPRKNRSWLEHNREDGI